MLRILLIHLGHFWFIPDHADKSGIEWEALDRKKGLPVNLHLQKAIQQSPVFSVPLDQFH